MTELKRLVLDFRSGEMVEAELNRLMEKRSTREMDPDEQEELWKASVRRYNARRREANRIAWCDYYRRIAASLQARASEYFERAQRLEEHEPQKETA